MLGATDRTEQALTLEREEDGQIGKHSKLE